MSAIALFDGNKDIVEYTNKQGKTARLMTAKEFKALRNLKGSEGKRAFNAYIRENGVKANSATSAAIASGKILIKGIQTGENGGTIKFILASAVEDKPTVVKASKTAEELSRAQAIIAANEARIRQLEMQLAGPVAIKTA